MTVPALQAAELSLDFDTGLGDAIVSGHAKHVPSGGVNDSGYVSITDAIGSQQGGLTLPDIDAGGPQGSFTLSFMLRIGGGTARPADGFSVNIVPAGDPAIGSNVGEEGPGRGLTVSFDTWDNGGESPTAPNLDVKMNGLVIAQKQAIGEQEAGRARTTPIYRYTPAGGSEIDFDLRTGNTFQPVVISYRAAAQGGGLLDVSYKGHLFFDDLPVNVNPGTYRVMMGARTGGATDNHWVDSFVFTTGGLPEFHRVTRTYPNPGGSIFGDENLQVDILDGASSDLNTATVTATLNGTALPASALSFVRNGETTTVTVNPPADLPRRSNQSLALTFGTGVGAETATLTLPFLISPINSTTLFIEAEDIDFGAGQFLTESQAADYPGGAYASSLGVDVPLLGTDYSENSGNPGDDLYRVGEGGSADFNIGMNRPGPANVGDRIRTPTLTRTEDFKVGWNDAGEWYNYTRDFAAAGGNYEIWGRLASGGADIAASLSLVQDVETQVTAELGRFNNPGTGGWDSFVFVPLRRDGEVANIVLRGRETVRFTVLPGNLDFNYLAFVPTEAAHKPAIVGFSPTTGVRGRGTVTFTASIIEQTDIIDPSTVTVTVGGRALTDPVVVKGGQLITVTGGYTDFGYFQSRDAVVTFQQAGASRSVTFPLTSGGGVTYRRYDGITGGAWQEVVNHAKFVNNQPDLVTEIPRFEHDQTNPNLDNFGGHLIAYFRPPANGPYQFNLSADDGAALWLSTDDKPYNKVLIATQSAWSGFRAFNTQTDQGQGSTPAERVSPMINLEAGRRYYIEAVYHEGGGGDNISVTYRNSTTTPWVNGTPGLSEVEPFTGADFSVTPQPVTTSVGRRAEFIGRLVAEQGGPITYEWLRNGEVIPNETTGNLVFPAVTIGDNGAMISLRATINGQIFTSPAVLLTVNADNVAPTIASVRTRNYHELALEFSEDVRQLALDSFTINNGVTITAIDHDPAFGRKAMLTTSGLTEGTTYTITVVNMRDLADNAGTGTASVTPVFSTRFSETEYFRNIPGILVADLTAHAKYPQAPDEVVYNSLFEAPGAVSLGGIWENYGANVHGFFIPPRDGQIIFYMAADDQGELWLSSDANPANKVLIAREPVWNGIRQWVGGDNGASRGSPPANESGLINVLGGTKYYIELIYKEGGGGDHGSATYMYGDETDAPANGTAPRLRGTAIGVVVNGAGRSVTFNGPITGSPILQGRSGTLTGSVTAAPAGSTVGYQWSRRLVGEETFTEIDGANSATLNIGPVAMSDEGTVYRLTAFTLGATATADVTLDVTPDTTAPGVVGTSAAGIRFGANAADIGLVFSEPVDAASAENPARYTTSVGTVASAVFFAADNGVAVRVNGLTAGQTGTITITGVTDPYGNAMPAVTLPFTVGNMSWVAVGGNAPESTQPEGVVALSATDFDVISGGSGQWDTYDESTLVYEAITGNFDKKVRVAFQDSSSQWARAGLIVKESLDAGKERLAAGEIPAEVGFSRYQKVHVNPAVTAMGTAGNNNFELNRRLERGAVTSNAALSNGGPPPYPNVWVRLKREGDVLTMYRSDNGNDWLQLGTTTLAGLASQVFVGPDYSPENANITANLRRSWLAQFRDYGNVIIGGEPPTISVQDTATGIRITFTGALYSADTVDGTFTRVAGATSPHDVTVPAGAGMKFYVAGPQ